MSYFFTFLGGVAFGMVLIIMWALARGGKNK